MMSTLSTDAMLLLTPDHRHPALLSTVFQSTTRIYEDIMLPAPSADSPTDIPSSPSSADIARGIVSCSRPGYADFDPTATFLESLPLPALGRTGEAEGALGKRCAEIREDSRAFFGAVAAKSPWRQAAFNLSQAPIPPRATQDVVDAICIRQVLFSAAVRYTKACTRPALTPLPDSKKYPRRLNNALTVLCHPESTNNRSKAPQYVEKVNDAWGTVERFLDSCSKLGGKDDDINSKVVPGTTLAASALDLSEALCKTAGSMFALSNILLVVSWLNTDLTFDPASGAPLVPDFMKDRLWGRKNPPTRADMFRPLVVASCYSALGLFVDFGIHWDVLGLHPMVSAFTQIGSIIPYSAEDCETAGVDAINDFVWREVIGGIANQTGALTRSKIQNVAKKALASFRAMKDLFVPPEDMTVLPMQQMAIDWPVREQQRQDGSRDSSVEELSSLVDPSAALSVYQTLRSPQEVLLSQPDSMASKHPSPPTPSASDDEEPPRKKCNTSQSPAEPFATMEPEGMTDMDLDESALNQSEGRQSTVPQVEPTRITRQEQRRREGRDIQQKNGPGNLGTQESGAAEKGKSAKRKNKKKSKKQAEKSSRVSSLSTAVWKPLPTVKQAKAFLEVWRSQTSTDEAKKAVLERDLQIFNHVPIKGGEDGLYGKVMDVPKMAEDLKAGMKKNTHWYVGVSTTHLKEYEQHVTIMPSLAEGESGPIFNARKSIAVVTGEWMKSASIGAVLDLFADHGAILIKKAIPDTALLQFNKEAIRQDPLCDGSVPRRAQLQSDVPASFGPHLYDTGGMVYMDLSLDQLMDLREAADKAHPILSLLSYPRGHVTRHTRVDHDDDVDEWIPHLSCFAHCIEAWDALGRLPGIHEDIDPPTAFSAWEMWQTAGTYHPPHWDFAGSCTGLLVLCGSKVWMLFEETEAMAVIYPEMTADEPYEDTSGTAPVVEAGDALFFAPHPHAVLSEMDCIVKGSNFFCMVQMTATLMARLVQHYAGDKVTNLWLGPEGPVDTAAREECLSSGAYRTLYMHAVGAAVDVRKWLWGSPEEFAAWGAANMDDVFQVLFAMAMKSHHAAEHSPGPEGAEESDEEKSSDAEEDKAQAVKSEEKVLAQPLDRLRASGPSAPPPGAILILGSRGEAIAGSVSTSAQDVGGSEAERLSGNTGTGWAVSEGGCQGGQTARKARKKAGPAAGRGQAKKNELKQARSRLQKAKEGPKYQQKAGTAEGGPNAILNNRRGWVERSKQRLRDVELLSIQEPLSQAAALLCDLSSASVPENLQCFNHLLKSHEWDLGAEAALPLPDLSSHNSGLELQMRQTLDGIAISEASSKLLFFSKCLLQLRLGQEGAKPQHSGGALSLRDPNEVKRIIKRVNAAVDVGTKWARLAQGGIHHSQGIHLNRSKYGCSLALPYSLISRRLA
ncbi:hypothetical protein CALVIDRAFT_531640 [Calocera viscosa TUFC12733]|uniref:JmjC domain-containing protein n=1 Tax=Calocera viscosa (strain TUFC12733) TaxID=1330018 RepID=A0A167G2V5_CALVF|nr:hypothetical protein CALVIDRAFT_531640 [Calocera viscosa TUFC12733]